MRPNSNLSVLSLSPNKIAISTCDDAAWQKARTIIKQVNFFIAICLNIPAYCLNKAARKSTNPNNKIINAKMVVLDLATPG